MKHKHVMSIIEYRGKPDSVYVICDCGHVDCIPDWWEKCPRDWKKSFWKETQKVIRMFLKVRNAHRAKENA
jgi:hypothetical protein